MTRLHFTAMADIVKAILHGAWTTTPPSWADDTAVSFGITETPDYDRAVQTAEAFIVLATRFNPLFDAARFLVACELAATPTTTRTA